MKQLSPALSWAVPVQALLLSEFRAPSLGQVTNGRLQPAVFMMCREVVKTVLCLRRVINVPQDTQGNVCRAGSVLPARLSLGDVEQVMADGSLHTPLCMNCWQSVSSCWAVGRAGMFLTCASSFLPHSSCPGLR